MQLPIFELPSTLYVIHSDPPLFKINHKNNSFAINSGQNDSCGSRNRFRIKREKIPTLADTIVSNKGRYYGVIICRCPVAVMRYAPCRRSGCVAHRPLPLARVAPSATGSAPSLPGLSPAVRVRPVQRINPIVNVSFTMGFIGIYYTF